MTRSRPPIELTGSAERWSGRRRDPDADVLHALRSICEVVTDGSVVAESSRDWWPLALHWSLAGEVPRRAAAVIRPRSTAEVAAAVAICGDADVAVTTSGGRSGVCGAAIPVFGGIVLDTSMLAGVGTVDADSGVVEARAGTFGPDLESVLQSRYRLSIGHFPQSFDISTVGGWVACRGAGQYSTRYGKIEDMVVGLEVVLADGRTITTGGAPAAASGPDLGELFIGSEGTLGIITHVWLRAHDLATAQRSAAFRFQSFDTGVEACRQILRAGATPAVLRLYDSVETARSHGGDGNDCALLVLDEGDARLVDATMEIVEEKCLGVNPAASVASSDLVDHWLEHRNDTAALAALTRRGLVVDTMEIAASWSQLADIYARTIARLRAVPHARSASCHLSHSYSDGACLYFSFAASPPTDEIEHTYRALWDAGQQAALEAGGNLSHHHGVGINRQRFMRAALGDGLDVLRALKTALDPRHILNPGKLGLDGVDGAESPWP